MYLRISVRRQSKYLSSIYAMCVRSAGEWEIEIEIEIQIEWNGMEWKMRVKVARLLSAASSSST